MASTSVPPPIEPPTPANPVIPVNEPPAPPQPTQLASIGTLLSRSWNNFKRNIGSLVLLWLIPIAAGVGLIIGIGVMVLSSLGISLADAGNLETFDWSSYLTSINWTALIAPGAVIVGLLFLYAILATAVTYAQVGLVGDTTKQSLGVYLKNGFKLIIPGLVIDFLAGIIVFGNLFLLVVPTMVVSVFLCLTSFEMILNGKRGSAALRGSTTIVKQHFGYLFSRWLVLVAIQIVIQLVSYLLKQLGESGELALAIFDLLMGLVISPFMFIYTIELYKEVKDKTDWNRPSRITWMWITALVGWVIFGLIAWNGYNLVSRLNLPATMENYLSQPAIPLQEN